MNTVLDSDKNEGETVPDGLALPISSPAGTEPDVKTESVGIVLPSDNDDGKQAETDHVAEISAVDSGPSVGMTEENVLPVMAGHDQKDTGNETMTPDSEIEYTETGNDDGDADENDAGEETEDPDVPVLPVASVVEAILFAAREPLKLAQIARAVKKGTRQEVVRQAIEELNIYYLDAGRAFEIAEISGRFQLMSRPEYVQHIRRIYPKRDIQEKEKSAKLTPAALDTLSIIAYKQPVTRGEIEHIRGVGCGPVLRALIERGSVRVAGKRTDLVGQPLVYGTTEAFLAEFGLGSLEELPLRNEFLSLLPDPHQGAVADPDPEAEEAAETEPTPPTPEGDHDGSAISEDGVAADAMADMPPTAMDDSGDADDSGDNRAIHPDPDGESTVAAEAVGEEPPGDKDQRPNSTSDGT